PVTALAALAPKGNRRMGANPHVNGGRVLRNLDLPDFTDYAISVGRPGSECHESTRQLGKLMRDVFTRNARQQNFRLFCPDETNSNRLGDVLDRKSIRLNSSHVAISYAVFCLKKKKNKKVCNVLAIYLARIPT